MRHDSVHAEYLAAFWHKAGYAFSVAGVVSSVGMLLIAVAGAKWHKWAEKQHWQRLDEMKKSDALSKPGNLPQGF